MKKKDFGLKRKKNCKKGKVNISEQNLSYLQQIKIASPVFHGHYKKALQHTKY